MARVGLAALLLVAGCMSRPTALPASHPSPPAGAASEVGVTDVGAASVHDIRYRSRDRAVAAYLIVPRQKPSQAGVIFFHWLSSQAGNRNEFKTEAVELAGRGIASILIQGNFPWVEQPTGAVHDISAIHDEVADVEAGVDVLLAQPGLAGKPFALVGHDYGAMHGSVVLSEDPRFAGAVLMAADARWVDWFAEYFSYPKTPAERADYAKALQPLDPATVLRSVRCKVLLQFGRSDEYIPVARAQAVEAAVPARLRETRWYDSDHGLNDSARAERDSWLETLLGV